ncbi:regulatory protein RecX [uncultured Desulfobacter sp.]|uniref:regulatory protein RecX n=1 Tax=uncultured Desulfobacter sp. TaxID=240139 RepID=UPI002AAAB0D8|nr:regulatory protein RecX [uncultured Desulfobacter sp.]
MTVKTAYHQALRYLSKTPKTIRQMAEYLADKGYDANIIEQIISQLVSLNYLNDRAFAENYIESRIRHKPKSVFALGYELRQKGIDPALSEQLLTDYNDMELALKAVDRKRQTWKTLSESERRKKMTNYLRYRGFDYGVCQAVCRFFKQS